jgi:homoserine kinase
MNTATVQVPATTSNFGPGFDCLGAALRLYNRVTVTRGEPAGEAHPMVQQVAETFFQSTGREPFPFKWSIEGEVPMSRGLGSSVTLRLGLLHGLNLLSGHPLNEQQLYERCAALEGHPDNAAPAQFGGFTVASGAGVMRFPVSSALQFVLLIPNFEIRTADARRLLPPEVSRLAAVESCGRACRITAAFALGQYDRLGEDGALFADEAFHQSHRTPLIPFLPAVLAAGRAAGALGGFLSGSGSTIACLTLRDPEKVGAAMREAAGPNRFVAKLIITQADNQGARRL